MIEDILWFFKAKFNRLSYDEYIKSNSWKKRADSCKKRAKYRCSICNTPGRKIGGSAILEAHHRTYENLGYETKEDLICLCRQCHLIFTSNNRLSRHP